MLSKSEMQELEAQVEEWSGQFSEATFAIECEDLDHAVDVQSWLCGAYPYLKSKLVRLWDPPLFTSGAKFRCRVIVKFDRG